MVTIFFLLFIFFMDKFTRKGGSNINCILLTAFIACAVVFDVKSDRIPNILNGTGCLAGALSQLMENGAKGVLGSLAGVLMPVGILFALFAFRIVGAGDIKLLAMIGAFVGVDIWIVMALAFLLTAVYGAAVLLRRLMMSGSRSLTKIHMSIPIAVGVIFYIAGGGWIGL